MHKKRPNDENPIDRLCDIACEVAERHVQPCMERFLANLAQELPGIIRTAAQALYAGQRVPKGTVARRAQRNAQIRAEHADGQNIAELSRRHYLSPRTIACIVKEGAIANDSDRKPD